MGKSIDKPRWNACNVMGLGPMGPRLWQVSISGETLSLARPTPIEGPEAIQPKLIGKDWNEVIRPRLNVAWLPPEHVFIRVVQLPKAEDFAETVAMIEFQLEKLSPLPTAQIVWTFEIVPARGLSETQTAVLVVVTRSAVEDLLGKLEGQGFLADRLELPFLDQILTLEINHDAVLLFPVVDNRKVTFFWMAWWYGGVLRSLGQIHLPAEGDPVEVIQAQLSQMSWAGELEGWLNSPPRYHLVADEEVAEEWLDRLQARLELPFELFSPSTESNLALLVARRASRADSRAGLLPVEHSSRYRQQYVDKLWMQSIFGVVACYLFAVLIYFAIVAVKGYQRDTMHDLEVAQGVNYTNTLKLRDQVRVLQEQINLQFSALNCYLTVATNLPAELSLDNLNFEKGMKLVISGSGSAEAAPRVHTFLAALQKAQNKDQKMFSSIDGPTVNLKPGGAQISWNLTCNIQRSEVE